MKNGTCPKCGSTEIIGNLRIHGGEGHPPFVSTIEPEPEKHSFVWLPGNQQSHFRAYVCGACGYTEFYAEEFQQLNEGRKKGYRSA
jgi:predicted nucleic-acid-binding Zn-ribbon protein